MDTAKKKCKNCQSEIDAKARKCPHCQSDLRSWFARHPILTGLIAIIGIIVVISAAGSGSKTQKQETKPEASEAKVAAENPVVLAKIGEAVDDSDLSFTVKDVKSKTTLGTYYSKNSQGLFYIVTVGIKNTGKDTKMIDSSQFKVKDNQGRTFDRSIDGQTALGLQQGRVDLFLQQVQPSLAVTGDIVFDVPKDATGLKLVVKGSLFSQGKEIDLGK